MVGYEGEVGGVSGRGERTGAQGGGGESEQAVVPIEGIRYLGVSGKRAGPGSPMPAYWLGSSYSLRGM